MVVGLAFQNREGTIKLLDKNQAHHLMTEGHGRERQFGIGAVVHFLCETVRPTYDEHQPFCSRNHLFFKAFGELNRGVLFAVFV